MIYQDNLFGHFDPLVRCKTPSTETQLNDKNKKLSHQNIYSQLEALGSLRRIQLTLMWYMGKESVD